MNGPGHRVAPGSEIAVLTAKDARVRVVICRNGRFIVVRNVDGDHKWWSLPGGGVEVGETLGEAAVREVREETGFEVRLIGVLDLAERKAAEGYSVGVTFQAEVVGGDGHTGDDPTGIATEVRWVTLGEALPLLGDNLGTARAALRQGQHPASYSHVQP
ncbi:MAG: hypothetical protein CL878_15860 [Dehalococcoidia bacterium]|nr:hypothetical protein [Dehalococcoidia bacterium]